ncbi:hypothetical protein MLD38_039467 [Melastoma candidum]|uniref:Uncharacterized protein n=1 Tax=Melastoma candidum TaxID=119954 RepID=A0ACB9L4H8_9MYRT|nr:hypothetical protein MLD38_039467 [Melastoma candidum]
MSAESAAMHPLATAGTIGFLATKGVFVTAFGFAIRVGENVTQFEEELKASAREQIEFMLCEDEDMALVAVDEEVKSLVWKGLSEVFSSFKRMLSSLIPEAALAPGPTEVQVVNALMDLEWMSNILPKINLMKEFVTLWLEISSDILGVIEDPRLGSLLWRYKSKLVEVMGKVLDAVAYGNVILPALSRVRLLKMWLPYIRKMKPLLDWKSTEEEGFCYQIDQDLCQSIEGAVVSLVSALPSNDQAEILADWLRAEQVQYPDLAEAFEIWCYRSKSARRRLAEGQAQENDEKDPALRL